MKTNTDHIQGAIVDMMIYFYCWDHKRTRPETGTPDWWDIFDIVRGDYTRDQMEVYLAEK